MKGTKLRHVPLNASDIVEISGGIVGKIKNLNTKATSIGLQFTFNNDEQKITSKIFTMDPKAARFTGKNLLKYGITEGIRKTFKTRK